MASSREEIIKSALFGKEAIRFEIPKYQRAYSWGKGQWKQFLQDLKEAESGYYLGHCRPIKGMAEVIGACPNVWTDTAYMPFDEFDTLNNYNWHGRLMFGTDIPVWQAHESTGLTRKYRDYMSAIAATGLERHTEEAFRNFVQPMIGYRE